MIASLEDSQKSALGEWSKAETVRREAETVKRDLESKLASFEKMREKMMEEAEAKANKAIANAREEADLIIEELRDLQKEGAAIKEHKLIDAKKHLDAAVPKLVSKKQKQVKKKAEKAKRIPKVGDEVKVLSLIKKVLSLRKLRTKNFKCNLEL